MTVSVTISSTECTVIHSYNVNISWLWGGIVGMHRCHRAKDEFHTP